MSKAQFGYREKGERNGFSQGRGIGADFLATEITIDRDRFTEEDLRRARLAVCAAAESSEEAAMFLKMLGLAGETA